MFDFDGTLIDTAPGIVSATNELLTNYKHSPLSSEVIRSHIGTGLKGLLHDFFPELIENNAEEERLTEEFLEIYRSHYLKDPKPFPGAKDFLERIVPNRGYQIAIVSNKKEQLIHPILDHLNLNEMPWVKIVGGDTFETMKPDPKPILSAIQEASVRPQEAVLVGDGAPDIQGAMAAQCHSIAVSFGYSPIEDLMRLGAHAQVDHYNELPDAIDKLLK